MKFANVLTGFIIKDMFVFYSTVNNRILHLMSHLHSDFPTEFKLSGKFNQFGSLPQKNCSGVSSNDLSN